MFIGHEKQRASGPVVRRGLREPPLIRVKFTSRLRRESMTSNGKSVRSAIDSGYERAIRTIVDANLTTGIAAAVLYQYGSGPIKGFATVLFWGIIVSMFTAIIVTRFVFDFVTTRKNIERLSI